MEDKIVNTDIIIAICTSASHKKLTFDQIDVFPWYVV
jgi:hypothetical protein